MADIVFRQTVSVIVFLRKLATPILCLTVGVLLVLAVTSFATAFEPPDPFLKDLEAVDKGTLHAAKIGLENYLGTRPTVPKWTIRVDEQNGVIETDWYRDHKGEVKLKAQIVV